MSAATDLLRDNDARFAHFASTLTAAEWTQPSLCTEWTNHEVLAHLVIGYTATPSSIVAGVLRHRGSFDRANADLACALAAQQTPAELINEFTTATSTPRGIGRIFPHRLLLSDHVIHELDISHALGKESAIPANAVIAVLNTAVAIPNPFVPAAAMARGLNLIATDTHWSRSANGPTVTGQAAHLVSVLAGRPWALQHLGGQGVHVLGSRLRPDKFSLDK